MADKRLRLYHADILAMKKIALTTKVESYEDDVLVQILGILRE